MQLPRRGLVRFAPSEPPNSTQVPRSGLVRFAASEERHNTSQEERKRHCTYCRKYHRGVCPLNPKLAADRTTRVAVSSKLDPFAFEFDPCSDEPHWSSDELLSSSFGSEASLELSQESAPEFLAAVHRAVEEMVPEAGLEPIPEANKMAPSRCTTLDCEMSSIEAAVHESTRVRNLAIIAHVDHGKTTIADRLLAKASMLRDQEVAKSCKMDTGALEIAKGITIKASSTGLLYPQEQLLINLVDCPGHVDFNGEVSAALRVTDGALLVVDCIEGVCVQTEMVLRQALTEGVVPILMLNKLDRAFGELQLSPEQAYLRLVCTIEAVNSIIREYDPVREVCPAKGNVIFGSGLFGWGFTLASMAAARGLTCSPSKLWGDRYVDKASGTFVRQPAEPAAERSFVTVVLQPLYRLHHIATQGDHELLAAFTARHKLPAPAPQPRCKDEVRAVLRGWLPCADAIVATAAEQLPSPAAAQQARAHKLGAGLEGTAGFDCIRACDPSGPLMVLITKMAPCSKQDKKLLALGRVFSGTVRPGDRVIAIEAQHGERVSCKVERVKLVMVDKVLELPAAPAGSLIGLVGVPHVGTVVQGPEMGPMPRVSLDVSPVVSMAIRPKRPADTSRVVVALRELVKMDGALGLEHDPETGEHCLVGAGELHMQSALHDLQELLPAGVLIQPGEPAVRCREAVLAPGALCLAKSSNKHNRVFARAVPLSPETQQLLESAALTQQTDEKLRGERLAAVGWERGEARRKVLRITGSNMLVDCTEGLPMHEVLEHLGAAFDSVVAAGVLTGSPVVGVRFELHEGTRWHKERTHRGPNQMAEPARRAFLAAMLSAEPRLKEPVLEVKVQVPEQHAQKVCAVLKGRRGVIAGYESDRLVTVAGLVPVEASFGLCEQLMKHTSGYASPQCCFSQWQQVPGDPLEESSLAGGFVESTRARKKLPREIPALSQLVDRL